MARRTAWLGKRTAQPEIATPTGHGIRQAFPMHSKPRWLGWGRQALKGLTYVVTGRGPQRWWQRVIGRREDDRCECGVAQNVAHLLKCSLVGDGKGRTAKEVWGPDRCKAVADFLA